MPQCSRNRVFQHSSSLKSSSNNSFEFPPQSDEQIQKLLATASSTPSGELGSFQPFQRDAEKQRRYEKYVVCARNGRADALPLLQPKSMTEWERERERVEFERAAVLFR